METTFRQIPFGSAEYEAECSLRNEVLRVPLGLNLDDEDLESEREQQHFGLFDTAGSLLACLTAVPLASNAMKLRQMVVRDGHRSQGLGKCLFQHVEQELSKQGVTELVLHARDSAVGFYEKLGFSADADPFLEVGILHQRMVKELI